MIHFKNEEEKCRFLGMYVLEGKVPRIAHSVEEWTDSQEDNDRQVALTQVDGGRVSTVFTGLDSTGGLHEGAPLLFETLAFPECRVGRRARTWEEAEENHRVVVMLVDKSVN